MKHSAVQQPLYHQDMPTPLGRLHLVSNDQYLLFAGFNYQKGSLPFPDLLVAEQETAVLALAKEELQQYFNGYRRVFSVPCLLFGTAFQKQVWDGLAGIPFGETLSYQELAGRIGRPKACRAVGQANHHNPVSIIIPCHRVIGKNGQLVGYGGGLDKKAWLLEWEKRGRQ